MDGDTSAPVEASVLTSIQDFYDDAINLPIFSPEELIGMTFLKTSPDGEGDSMRAKVVHQIMDRDAENHQQIMFLLSLGDGELEDLISYNKLCDLITEQMESKGTGYGETHTFKSILDHQGPLKCHDPKYKGSQWNVLVTWDDGTQTWEPLNIIGKHDEITLAKYAKENDLLSKPGWKFHRKTAKRQQFLNVALNAIKRCHDPTQIRYKFGVRLPCNHAEALRLDKDNGNTLWHNTVRTELDQIRVYDIFCHMGIGVTMDSDHHKINVQLVFDVKASGKQRGRLVACGDITPEPDEAVYSSVASLRSLRAIIFISELNQLKLWQGDVGDAYLESYTQENVSFIAGPEFGSLQGHTMEIIKALNGLRSSSLHFHEHLSSVLQNFGFILSFADPDVWMHDAGDCYEYIVVYMDDLIVSMKDPKEFFDQHQSLPMNFKLTGVGPASYHLGGDLFHDDDGTLCFGSQTYTQND